MKHQRNGSHKATKGQRSGISHKYSGRIGIEQQKSQKTSHNGSCNRSHSRLNSQCCNGEKGTHNGCHTGSKPIQTIGKIHTIYGSQHNDKYKNNKLKYKLFYFDVTFFHFGMQLFAVKQLLKMKTT